MRLTKSEAILARCKVLWYLHDCQGAFHALQTYKNNLLNSESWCYVALCKAGILAKI